MQNPSTFGPDKYSQQNLLEGCHVDETQVRKTLLAGVPIREKMWGHQ